MSCTKLATLIAALQCVERGLITLNKPVNTILLELATKNIIALKQQSTEQNLKLFFLDFKKNEITLRMLLTHTSGIAYAKWHLALVAWQLYRHAATEWEQPLVSEPGREWIYGASHDWIGVLISRLNKVTLEEYFIKNVFRPLSLTSSTFIIEHRPFIQEQLVKTEYKTSSGWVNADHLLANQVLEGSAGSGLYSSVADYMAILGDLLKENPQLISAESVNQMFSPQLDAGSPQVTSLYNSHKFYRNLTCGSLEGLDMNFGLSSLLFLNGIPATGAPPGTMAWVGLPNLIWAVNRDKGVALMYASQILPPGDEKSTALATEFQKAVWQLVI